MNIFSEVQRNELYDVYIIHFEPARFDLALWRWTEMSMDEQGILYYEYTCVIPERVCTMEDVSFSKHKRYGTIYGVDGKHKLQPENWHRDFWLDDVIIGFEVLGDVGEDDIIITMFDFDGDNNEYFMRKVIALLARKLHKASKKEKNE